MGFTPLIHDQNVFRRGNIMISTYVDDFMVLGSSDAAINAVIRQLAKELEVKDFGRVATFLGIQIDHSNDSIRISQPDKVAVVYEDLSLKQCRGAWSPIADEGLITRTGSEALDDAAATRYRSIVGSLLHISIMTRPDIQFAVNQLAQIASNPSMNTMLGLKHLVL